MKLATRPRIAIAATMLATGALLTPASPASAAQYCYWENCSVITVYYSDASHTTIVGEYWMGQGVDCGWSDWGDQTVYTGALFYRC
jgi:hypothetical protein